MVESRRAASTPYAVVVRTALAVISMALGAVLALWGGIAVRMARKVVTPAARIPDCRILELDTSAQTITLTRTPDTELPGRYGLFTSGTERYLKVGSVLTETPEAVKRKLLTHVGPQSRIARDAAFSGWYYERPEELHLAFSPELVGSALGPCPAWLFPAGDGDTWVIQVHGRGATRAECLRAVPVFHGLGITSLVVSYRNDGEAPRSRSGTYMLGATEWRDVDAAVGFARRRGAKKVIVMGWSMGGAISLQLALNSAHRDLIVGLILDSPAIDWRNILDYQARELKLPAPITRLAITVLGADWATALTGSGAAIPFRRLDVLARAAELRHPILVLHSDDDGFVPSDASHDLVVARPDLVELDVFSVARHTKLWNYDQERWTGRITRWLTQHGLVTENAVADR